MKRNAYGEIECAHGLAMTTGCNPCQRKSGTFDKDGIRVAFVECAACAAKPGSPTLCASCLSNRELIDSLRGKVKDLTEHVEEVVQERLDEMGADAASFDKDLWKHVRKFLEGQPGFSWEMYPDGLTADDVHEWLDETMAGTDAEIARLKAKLAEPMGWRLGLVVHDAHGHPWVYFGHRVTSVGSVEREFVEREAGRHLSRMPRLYHASSRETLVKRFPDLADKVPEDRWDEVENSSK